MAAHRQLEHYAQAAEEMYHWCEENGLNYRETLAAGMLLYRLAHRRRLRTRAKLKRAKLNPKPVGRSRPKLRTPNKTPPR